VITDAQLWAGLALILMITGIAFVTAPDDDR